MEVRARGIVPKTNNPLFSDSSKLISSNAWRTSDRASLAPWRKDSAANVNVTPDCRAIKKERPEIASRLLAARCTVG